ncbi:peptidylprolyl isomerase [Erysipelothrix sp. HDW6C]|uniref:peptidylprolyl isomerase n=1 Tax=Erysipelothrix sp. HDW6C TaxID=2714930 RepID=UPI00140E5828|nr:peptidylprolyl isomerase [Erysipelothrix sp. HDW6C]QIK70517.1 peptidylprolyl isomerase [Erysipelothrix sp. HDW6C]
MKTTIKITMENGQEMVAELYEDVAPKTVANFLKLVEEKFYDGVIFHRVIPGFMIQGGDPDGTGMGGPGYSIEGEFTSNGFKNDLKHTTGVLSMARAMDPNSAGSQFFIMAQDSPHLDGQYAAFGKVIEGLDTIQEIVSVKRNHNDRPDVDQRIATIRVI